ncbi:MAG: hypothetical protein ACRELD_09990 [Longimicrobiales bacterium]
MSAIPQPTPAELPAEPVLTRELALAFAPLHKRALGLAVGSAAAVLVFGLTAFHLLAAPEPAPDLTLLDEYFYGYSVSWQGALIGTGWAFFAGFVAGWFLAFTRNLAVAASIFITRTRAELAATRDFLDHI